MDIGRINFSIPSLLAGLPMPECKPPEKEPSGKSAEEMLKKALEFANQGMEANGDAYCSDYRDGMFSAYEDMAAHLEMLMKGAEQNG